MRGLAEQQTHVQATLSAITIGRIYRQKQFVYKDSQRGWLIMSIESRDSIRNFQWRWPR